MRRRRGEALVVDGLDVAFQCSADISWWRKRVLNQDVHSRSLVHDRKKMHAFG